jgi:hypothetical protein
MANPHKPGLSPGPLLIIALAGWLACGQVTAEVRERIGRAYDRTSGVLLYKERHRETYAGGELIAAKVRYIDPQGRTIGSKRVDFSQDPFVPEFQLDNSRTGHVEGLTRIAADSLQVRFREHANRELLQQQISLPRDAIADAGFDRFIESQWENLIDGKTLVRNFLVPSRLEFMEWRIRRKDDVDQDAQTGDENDTDTVRFALEIDSAFLRLVVPAIVVIYDRDTRRLMRYEGLSNLRDDSGENHSVRIEFEYLTSQAQAVQGDHATANYESQRHELATAISNSNAFAMWQTLNPLADTDNKRRKNL